MYGKLGVNCAHSSFFSNSTPRLQEIQSLGFGQVRILQPNYASVDTTIRSTATAAKTLGLYVVYGMQATLDGTFTSTSWTAYQNAVVAEATAVNGLVDEFQIGNEMENAKDGTITTTDIYNNMVTIAAAVKGVFSGKVSYSFSATNPGVWNTNAAALMSNANFDYIGANIYGGWNAPGTFSTLLTTHITNFSTKAKVTEFNIASNWATVPTDEDVQASYIAAVMSSIASANIPAYFFEWNHGSNTWAIKLTDGSYRTLLSALKGGRRTLTP